MPWNDWNYIKVILQLKRINIYFLLLFCVLFLKYVKSKMSALYCCKKKWSQFALSIDPMQFRRSYFIIKTKCEVLGTISSPSENAQVPSWAPIVLETLIASDRA